MKPIRLNLDVNKEARFPLFVALLAFFLGALGILFGVTESDSAMIVTGLVAIGVGVLVWNIFRQQVKKKPRRKK